MHKKIIAFDIGGTNIKHAVLNTEGKIIKKGILPTEHKKGAEHLWNKILNVIDSYQKDLNFQGIAVSTAGVVDDITGKVVYASENLPGWTGKEVKALLETKFSVPVVVDNDVNSAACGELWLGAGRGLKNFICITYGTGIGSGIIIDGKLYRGANKCAGEVSYLHQKQSLKKKNYCYSNQASTNALVALGQKIAFKKGVKNAKQLVNGKYIFEQVKQKEEDYCLLVKDWVKEVAKGLSDIYYLLDPEAIIIGGGVSESAKLYFPLLEEELKKFISLPFKVNLKKAQLGNNAGLVGATKLWVDMFYVN